MRYAVKEIFPTLQGEGFYSGRSAVFCRFSGCNLWSGREAHRSSATCHFCDTDFVGTDGEGGGMFDSPDSLADAILSHWRSQHREGRFVVCTGGEPLLQLDEPLIAALRARDFEIAVETNGTRPAPDGIDWICVSPKAGAHLVLTSGDELKLVFPQSGVNPVELEGLNFTHFFVQPMDGPNRLEYAQAAVQWCMEHPRWRLSLQIHKFLGIP